MPTFEGRLDATGLRVAVVVSRFNEFFTKQLLEGAWDCLRRHGADEGSVSAVWVPGAFEIPVVAKRLAESGQYDAVICLGAVIRGATAHFDYVAGQAAAGVARVALETGIPVIFGILTTDTLDQTMERSGSKSGNKGWEAALTAIEMVSLLRELPAAAGARAPAPPAARATAAEERPSRRA